MFGAPTAIIYVHAFLGACFCFYMSTGLLAVLNGEFGLVERDCPTVPTFLTPNMITPMGGHAFSLIFAVRASLEAPP